MMKYYVLYNAIAGQGKAEEIARALPEKLDGEVVGYADMTKITNYAAFLADKTDCAIVICGGDGTLNRFVNDTADCALENEIFYCASGSGNDFLRDIGGVAGEPIRITEYLKDLPTVEVNGKTYRFINGVGYGVDGYCCEEGDKQRAAGNTDINYTSIAIKGLLFHYKPTNAKVTVDGVTHTYKKVWIAPTMNGRFYGGGIMPTPDQKRNSKDGKLSILIFHRSGKIKTLMIFPSLFKGEHLKNKKYIELLCGSDITVEFDGPAPLQIDGETIVGVMKYRALAKMPSGTLGKEENELAKQ
ncbi:MAG: diacylglycerol kinase family protein [Ruminococcaceae bacterium]|nr:diacylglycerol kinase family protein [Oscillospiraceae bacterium]